jgi:hypothetical protein
VAAEEVEEAFGGFRQSDRLGRAEFLRERARRRDQLLGARQRARAAHGVEARLERQPANETRGIAGVQREEQAARLKIRPRDVVVHREPLPSRSHGIDAQELPRWETGRIALEEGQPA